MVDLGIQFHGAGRTLERLQGMSRQRMGHQGGWLLWASPREVPAVRWTDGRSIEHERRWSMTDRGFEPEDITNLEQAEGLLSYLADHDCLYRHAPDDPCERCQAEQALRALRQVLTPRMVGLHPKRMKNHAERIYVEVWRKHCKRQVGLNGGLGLLELLLRPEGEMNVQHVSQRDATVATTVVQWLGTNGGRAFVKEAEAAIEKGHHERQAFGVSFPGSAGSFAAQKELASKGELHQIATSVAEDFFSVDTHASVVRCLATAIVSVAVQWHERKLAALLRPEAEVKGGGA